MIASTAADKQTYKHDIDYCRYRRHRKKAIFYLVGSNLRLL